MVYLQNTQNIMSSSEETNQSIIFEALTIVQDETILRLEQYNTKLRQHISRLQQCSTTRFDVNNRLGSVREMTDPTTPLFFRLMMVPHSNEYSIDIIMQTHITLLLNSLLNKEEINEEDDSCDVITGYYKSPITDQPVTGVEALSTILSNSDELQKKLCLQKIENYYLTEQLYSIILQYKLDDLTLVTSHEWTTPLNPVAQQNAIKIAQLHREHVNRLEIRIRNSSNETNIDMIRVMNCQLRDLLIELDGIETDETLLKKFGKSYLRYESMLKLYSLDEVSIDVQDYITEPLLKMETKALAERVKGMILYLRLKWLWADKSRFDQEKKMGRRDLERMLSLPPRRG